MLQKIEKTNGQVAEDPKERQVVREIKMIQQGIDQFEDVTQELLQRIRPVLLESLPKEDTSNKPVEPRLVPLASELKSIYNRLLLINETVQDVLERLEL